MYKGQGWKKLHCDGPALWGAGLGWSQGRGILVGGINAEGECSGDVYSWHLDEKDHTIELQKWGLQVHVRSLTRRYGLKVIPWNQGGFVVVGGAGSHRILPWPEQFLFISSGKNIQVLDVRNGSEMEPWLVGHDVTTQENSDHIIIVGGGGVCFSFGSFWNKKIFLMSQSGKDVAIQQWKLVEETSLRHQQTQLSSTPQNLLRSKTIRRIRLTAPEQWHQILLSSEVCILEGLDFGTCVTKWTAEYLKSTVGPDKQVIIHSTDAEAMNFLAKNFKYTSTSFGDLIDSVFSTTAKRVYLRAISEDVKNKPTRLDHDYPGLAKDFKIPAILCETGGIEENRIFSTVLRVGGVGTSMWLHYDVSPTTSCFH